MQYRRLGNNGVRCWEAFSGKRFVCCALTVLCGAYNEVGRSIASIYDLGWYVYLGALRLNKYVSLGGLYLL